jgi:hypothetical protein
MNNTLEKKQNYINRTHFIEELGNTFLIIREKIKKKQRWFKLFNI